MILKLDNSRHALDVFADVLASEGYEVLRARAYAEALRLAHECQPRLVIVVDDPDADIDVLVWLEMQHSDPQPELALIPLLILADAEHIHDRLIEEMPGRVRVMRRPLDLREMVRTIRELLNSGWLD